MSDIAIRVKDLSKRYRIGLREETHDTLVGAAMGFVRQPLKNLRRLRRLSRFDDDGTEDIIWALNDISFEVKQGEVVGIIGRNGAGKSTLLKILSRITYPTGGWVELQGRVSSLLEVGTGFHPELTGRENVYLNGTILGMHKAEIDRKFDEIVEFSGVEKFIDTPVKRYSSGMSVRLAFSVAAHLEPEILLVNEVLAVGDLAFQKKCLGKMEDVSAGGRTVLFVSHNMAMIEALCPRSMLLVDGQRRQDGLTTDVITAYLETLKSYDSISLRHQVDRRGTGEIRITKVRILDDNGKRIGEVRSGQDCILGLVYETNAGASPSGVVFSVSFYSRGVHIFSVSTRFSGQTYDHLPSPGVALCRIPKLPLAPGIYQYNLFCKTYTGIADWVTDAGELLVSEGDFFGSGQLPSKTHPGALVEHTWTIEPIRA